MGIKEFEFKCSCCDDIHKGIPNLGAQAPVYYYGIPQDQQKERSFLSPDLCVLDDKDYFVRANLKIPLIDYEEDFSFGAWVSLSESNFYLFEERLGLKEREHFEPMFGWFSSWIWPYEETLNMKTMIHFQNDGIRPYIELEATDHPLALAQKNGITENMLIRIYEYYVYGKE